ncbi:MAG: GNAT family N-acetyltransferase [Proteobacteria bacterium]|nr:GNAT family N-acetyltransferase [Pseudomonadota bacterium]
MSSSYFFHNGSYLGNTTLKDGRSVVLRLVRPSDKDLLRRGFERLSPESRYFRFFMHKFSLSGNELHHLTEIDGMDHFAIGATVIKEDGTEEGVGVARFVRLQDEPEVAEPAIAIIDDFHNRGLGTLLLRHLATAALERGIKRFRGEVLTNNELMKSILNEVSCDFWFVQPSGGILEVDLEIPRNVAGTILADAPPKSTVLRRLLHVARKTMLERDCR